MNYKRKHFKDLTLFTGTRRAENPPEILVHPEGILERRTGEKVVMVCQAQGYPEPRIDFFKDGRKIRANENHVIGRTESSLVIKHFYKCQELLSLLIWSIFGIQKH